jgi:hypothetical protein
MSDKTTRDAMDAARRAAERAAMMEAAKATAAAMIGGKVISRDVGCVQAGEDRLSVRVLVRVKSGDGVIRQLAFYTEAPSRCFGSENTFNVEARGDLVVSKFFVGGNGVKVEFETLDGFLVKNATICTVVQICEGNVLTSFDCNSEPEGGLRAA